MATYCECGCVADEHDDYGVCYGEHGTCPCEIFTKVDPRELKVLGD